MKFLFITCMALALASCASYGGRGLTPGSSTEAEARALMGEPALQLAQPDGSRVLAYPKGPLGTQTYMVRLNREGVVQSIDQALNDGTFSGIRPGLTQAEILRMIGPPRETMEFPRLGHVAWDYKYTDDWGYPAIFSVTFDREGRVVSRISQRIERNRP